MRRDELRQAVTGDQQGVRGGRIVQHVLALRDVLGRALQDEHGLLRAHALGLIRALVERLAERFQAAEL